MFIVLADIRRHWSKGQYGELLTLLRLRKDVEATKWFQDGLHSPPGVVWHLCKPAGTAQNSQPHPGSCRSLRYSKAGSYNILKGFIKDSGLHWAQISMKPMKSMRISVIHTDCDQVADLRPVVHSGSCCVGVIQLAKVAQTHPGCFQHQRLSVLLWEVSYSAHGHSWWMTGWC